MENKSENPPISPSTPALPAPASESAPVGEPQSLSAGQRRTLIGIIIGLVILLALMVLSIVYLLQPSTDTAKIRDVFIIFLALQSMLTGFTLVILMIQLARLINLLQNEIKPILDSTNETVSNLRGTTIFLSDNLAGPVIKLNEYLAGLSQLIAVIGLARKPKRSPPNK
jgi:membrane protein implicated in regulation of membrane protease activity